MAGTEDGSSCGFLDAEPDDSWLDNNELRRSEEIWEEGPLDRDIAGCASSGFVNVMVGTEDGSSCGFLDAEPDDSWLDNNELKRSEEILDEGPLDGNIAGCASSGFEIVTSGTENESSGGFLDASLGSELNRSVGGVFPATIDIFKPP